MLPISTIVGLQVGLLLSGAILTETVFAFPGIGTWLQAAIENRDYPVIQGGILFVAIVVVLVNLFVDLSYAASSTRGSVWQGGRTMSIAEIEARELKLEPTGSELWGEALRRVLRNPFGRLSSGVVLIAVG